MLVRISRFAVVALAAGAILSLTSLAPAQTTYYVNGSCGDDSWTGLSPVCEAPNGPKATIQAGIDAADHFDSVEVADGIYRGLGNRNLEFFQKEMSIRSSGGPEMCIIDCENDGFGFTFCTLPDDRPVTIEGFTIRNGRGATFGGVCIAGADVAIDDCVIENCTGAGDGSAAASGGMLISSSSVLITRTIIRANSAQNFRPASAWGGGISINGDSDVSIEDCRIEDNQAISSDARGGGIFVNFVSQISLHMARTAVARNRAESTGGGFARGGGLYLDQIGAAPSEITDCDFIDNEAVNTFHLGAVGGGLSLGAEVVLTRCTVSGNRAIDGGGLVLASSRHTMRIEDSYISDNHAQLFGGGVDVSVGAAISFLRTSVVANTAGYDGGGYFASQGAEADWVRCEFIRNSAGRHGGGISAGVSSIDWCRVVENHADGDGGGIYAGNDELPRGLNIRNTLVAHNEASGHGGGLFSHRPDVRFGPLTIAHNSAGIQGGGLHIAAASQGTEYPLQNSIVRGNTPDSIIDLSGVLRVDRSNIQGSWPGVGNLDASARFVDPAGGDYRLGPDSPCIDAGDSRFVVADFDLAGQPRRVDDPGMPDSGIGGGAIVDMGAYEFQGTSTGFITVHPRPGIAGQSNQLQAAGATPGNTVYFVYGFNLGSTNVPGCPGVNVEIASPRIAAQATAEGSGYASSIIGIPGAAAGRSIVLQAVDHAACGVSNVVGYRFP